jgi:hypothetical protein
MRERVKALCRAYGIWCVFCIWGGSAWQVEFEHAKIVDSDTRSV